MGGYQNPADMGIDPEDMYDTDPMECDRCEWVQSDEDPPRKKEGANWVQWLCPGCLKEVRLVEWEPSDHNPVPSEPIDPDNPPF